MPPEQALTWEGLKQFLSNPYFWIFTVLLGYVINITSPHVALILSSLKVPVFQRRSAKRRKEFDDEVDKLWQIPGIQYQLKLDIIYHLLLQIIFGLFLTISIILIFVSQREVVITTIFAATSIYSIAMMLNHATIEREATALEREIHRRKQSDRSI